MSLLDHLRSPHQPSEDGPSSREMAASNGDFRGSYGYGRPAHRSDPSAEYGFQIGRPKVSEKQLRDLALWIRNSRGGDA